MADNPLQDRFPDMRPISGPPSLSTIQGIGLMAYGARDYDPETTTYVKTHCFCLVFVPLLAVGAYRVADAPGGGWYFIGKVPLSTFARLWNVLVLGGGALAIALVLWFNHTRSANYVAGRKLDEAERLAAAGQLGPAARLCAEVADGKTSRASAAVTQLEGMLARPVDGNALEQAAEAFQIAVELQGRRPGALPGLLERGLKVAEDHAQGQPRGAMLVLEAVAPLARPGDGRVADRQTAVLERLAAAEPGNVDYAVRLAVVYERRKQPDRCDKLLTPHRARLADTEGARVLGQLRAAQGRLDEAQELLTAYTEKRLARLRQLDQTLRQEERAAAEAIINKLKSGKAEGFDKNRYDRLPRGEQDKMVNDYIIAHFRENEAVRQAQDALRRADPVAVVSAGLDLGVVLLRRAQGGVEAADPAQRRALLEKAEKTFLAVRDVAGKSEEVNLNLGEVYYWLGKQQEGKKLFDDLLRDRGRAPEALLKVGMALRQVGSQSEARPLIEEAYNRPGDGKLKQTAAYLRSILALDLDDSIVWLKRSNQEIGDIRASLSTALGRKALVDGNDAEAIRHLREATAEYDRLPASASTLNNGALVYLALYPITGERADVEKANAMMEKALALKPNDSILLLNVAEGTMELALHDLIGPSVNFKALKAAARSQLLSHLYSDRAGRDRLTGALRAHALLGKAIQQFERLLVLAPRDATVPSKLSGLYALVKNQEALRRLDTQLRSANLDLERSTRYLLDWYTGKDLPKLRSEHAARLAQRRKEFEAARRVGGVTLAVATVDLSEELGRADALGLALNADELVRLAEAADKAAPSRGTRANLSNALLTRASLALAAKDPAYAAWLSKGRRSLGHPHTIALALLEDRSRAALLADADVRRASELQRQDFQEFPDEPSLWAWAILRSTHPEDADRLAKAVAADEAGRLVESLARKVSPLSAATVLNDYYSLRMAGQDEQARAVLRRAAKEGLPLPVDVK